jgi:hypothetical protein
MKIFKLEPKNLDSHHWNASVYNGSVIVRAVDEKKARRKAAFKFSIAVEIKSNSDATPISPWLLDDHVDCKEPYKPPKEVLVAWGLDKVENANFQRGKGCNLCMNSGYKGRTAIFEILVNDEMIKTMIAQKKTPLEITNEAVAAGKLITLKDAAINKVINGITTLEDAASVVMH